VKSLTDKILAAAGFNESTYQMQMFRDRYCEYLEGARHRDEALKPLLTALAKVAELFALECEKLVCVCKLNPYVGGLVPCEVCRMRVALAELERVLAGEGW
jgi:hypothetical protein